MLSGCAGDTTVYHTYVPQKGPDENYAVVKRLLARQGRTGTPLPTEKARTFETAIAQAAAIHPDHPEVKALQARYAQLQESRVGPVADSAWPKEFRDPLGIEYVLIPAGEFMMGSDKYYEKPVHRVRISKPFYLGKYEVTQAQWQAVMGSNPSCFKGSSDRPVETVSWNDCQQFCRQLSQRIGLPVRLPSEAEWEYACRAGSLARYCFGDDTGDLSQYAYHGSLPGSGPLPVGSKKPNDWGLHDMHGNVFEWCQDPWHGNYNGAPADGSTWTSGGNSSRRVFRGGSWDHLAYFCRSAFRYRDTPDGRTFHIGFRVSSGTH